VYDVIVIGLGPAGLAARCRLSNGGKSVLSVDLGTRDAVRSDLLRGLGGAGLYSDGKFSFRPSASELWSLTPSDRLERAERWFLELYDRYGGLVPGLPVVSKPFVGQKIYPSQYLDFDTRASMIRDLYNDSDQPCEFGRRVTGILEGDKSVQVSFSDGERVAAHHVVIATGRLGAMEFSGSLQTVFRRLEFGVRLEAPKGKFSLGDSEQLDTKLIGELEAGITWRTFCVCRDGQVEKGNWMDGILLSGRADCEPTGRSNCGILVRIGSAETSRSLGFDDLVERILSRDASFSLPLAGIADDHVLSDTFGIPGARLVKAAIDEFCSITGVSDQRGWTVLGPCLEGTGLYPGVGSSLECNSFAPGRVLVAGDAAGKFRGLTAALVSGSFCAEGISAYAEESA
jgi:uncharacterized protein